MQQPSVPPSHPANSRAPPQMGGIPQSPIGIPPSPMGLSPTAVGLSPAVGVGLSPGAIRVPMPVGHNALSMAALGAVRPPPLGGAEGMGAPMVPTSLLGMPGMSSLKTLVHLQASYFPSYCFNILDMK